MQRRRPYTIGTLRSWGCNPRILILHPRSSILYLLSFILALCVAGCGTDEARSPVHGKVFYQGKPLPRGTIEFTPDVSRGCTGPLAAAEIQPDGSFALHTEKAEGAFPGCYRVTVLAVEPPSKAGNGFQFVVPRSLLPEKYRDPIQSGLACEVQPGKVNGINFNLD